MIKTITKLQLKFDNINPFDFFLEMRTRLFHLTISQPFSTSLAGLQYFLGRTPVLLRQDSDTSLKVLALNEKTVEVRALQIPTQQSMQ